MTDVDPRKLYKYIMNTVIMDKKHDMKSAQVFSWVELELPPNGAGLRDERKINLLNGPPDGKSLLRCQFNRWHISQRGAESPRRSGRSHHSSIHDNIVVLRKRHEGTLHKSEACLDRCNEKRIVLQPSKSNFCLTIPISA